MSSKQQKRKAPPEEDEGPPTPPETVDGETITEVAVSKDDPETLEIIQKAKRPKRSRTPVLMMVEDDSDDEEFIPEEVFKQYEEFRQDGSENALMFFVKFKQYEKWGPWIMTETNYKKAKKKYLDDQDSPLVAAAAAVAASDECK